MWWLTTKNEHITLDLSGTRISYDSPLNYSKRYLKSLADVQTQYRINIHDQDLYKSQNTNAVTLHAIRQSFWDYGQSLIWRCVVKGTLSMTVSLYRTSQPEFDAQNTEAFIKALQADFDEIYGKKNKKRKYKDIAPENYQIKTLSGMPWVYYEYSVGGERIKKLVNYAYPLSDRNYFKVQFNFIINSEDQKDKWKQQAQATIDFIMASFEVK